MRHAEIECRLLAAPDGINLLFALSQFGHLNSALLSLVGSPAYAAAHRSAILRDIFCHPSKVFTWK
jgi:hypothetical protein